MLWLYGIKQKMTSYDTERLVKAIYDAALEMFDCTDKNLLALFLRHKTVHG